jgi:hypothetical protein
MSGARRVWIGMAVALAACGGGGLGVDRSHGNDLASSGKGAEPDSVPLRDPRAFPHDFVDRQKIRATYGARSLSFDAVLQKLGDTLTLVGLTPFGSRAFVLRQVGATVSFQSFVPEQLPFPPRYMVVDIQRVFLPWIATDDAGSLADPDGTREGTREGEGVREEWRGGRLLRRTFHRLNGHPPGTIVIEYGEGMSEGGALPPRVVLSNGWYGYRLEITTESHAAL